MPWQKRRVIQLQGPEGPQGETGIQGRQGLQGVQGLQGIQGLMGYGVNIKGVVANTGALPSGSTTGDCWIVQADNHLYVWDSSTWIDAGPISVQGIQGRQGIQSVQGLQGLQGFQGFQGIQSVQFRTRIFSTICINTFLC